MSLGCPFGSEAASKKKASSEEIGINYLDASFKVYDSINKSIHSFAEPGFQEFKSAALLESHLEENGFTVEKGVAGIPTAFVATFGSGSPVIGIMAEYDALPGLSQDTVAVKKPLFEGGYGHGCGHNMLGTGSVAAVVAISKWLAQGHQGTIKLFGCPAEEGGGAKNYMVRDGVFNGLDAIFNWHPSTSNAVRLNPGLASMNIMFTFHGKTAHAAGSPWKGRSALDAVEAFDIMVNMLREHVTPETRIHYVITDGGEAPNVVPDVARVNYYIRHSEVKEMMNVFERVKKAAEGAALGTGTTMECDVLNANYPIVSNWVLCRIIHKALMEVGGVKLDDREFELCRGLLESLGVDPSKTDNFEKVEQTIPEPKKGGGSSDVGSVSLVAPLGRLYVASSVNGSPGHCWQQVALGGSTIGTKAVINVGKVFYKAAVELYGNPEAVKAARDEFEKAVGKDHKYVSLVGDRKPALDYRKKK